MVTLPEHLGERVQVKQDKKEKDKSSKETYSMDFYANTYISAEISWNLSLCY